MLPGFQRKDPRVRFLTYQRSGTIALDARAVVVEPFPAPQGGRPRPPDFAPFLMRSITAIEPGASVEDGKVISGEGLLVRGRTDRLHRLGAGGLRVHVSLELYDTSTKPQILLWSGAVKADWVRRFPTDDCLQLIADYIVLYWTEA